MKKILYSIIALAVIIVVVVLFWGSKEKKDSNQDNESAAVSEGDFNPTLIFDLGGKFDKSFNESAYMGAERFKADNDINYLEFEVTNEAQREIAIRRMTEKGGNPVIGIGFAQASSIEKIAKEYPDRFFATVDGVADAPNVKSVLFKENEGSFLVGVIAALKSKTNVIGFVGGMDIPLIRKFACGYVQGAKSVNPKITVIVNMTGNDASAWNNPGRGGELAIAQVEKSADVIFAAAGGTGIGVYQAAKDKGIYAIGVDSNQNYLYPGTMLTSMVKKVDVAVYEVFNSVKNDNFVGGMAHLGLADDGVDWAYDEHNKDLITSEIKKSAEKAKKDIINGKIDVHDYMSDNNCPSQEI